MHQTAFKKRAPCCLCNNLVLANWGTRLRLQLTVFWGAQGGAWPSTLTRPQMAARHPLRATTQVTQPHTQRTVSHSFLTHQWPLNEALCDLCTPEDRRGVGQRAGAPPALSLLFSAHP